MSEIRDPSPPLVIRDFASLNPGYAIRATRWSC